MAPSFTANPRHSNGKMAVLFLLVSAGLVSFCTGQLTRDQRQYLLDGHNAARRDQNVANMRLMLWNTSLAALAEETARACSTNPADRSTLSAAINGRYSWVGENRYFFSSAQSITSSVLESSLNCWLTPGGNCDQTERDQALFADSYLIGCGAKTFTANDRCHIITTGVVVVCFYAPGLISTVDSVPGEPCSRCPSEASQCITGLCAANNAISVVPPDPVVETPTGVQPRLYWIQNGYGSYAGGTLITLHGRGFSEDQFNRDNPNLGNRVIFTNQIHNITCAVEPYYSSTTVIRCRTGPSPVRADGDYIPIVTVDGQSIQLCDTTQAWCQFHYRSWRTPYINTVTPHAIVPGVDTMNITLSGLIFSYRVSDTQEIEDEPYPNFPIDRLLVGGALCNPWTEDETTPYGGEFTTTWGLGHIYCRPEVNRIDSMNATILVENVGRSQIPIADFAIDNKLRQYIFQTHSDITKIEPNTGSPEGGTLITIYGIHLYDQLGDVKVNISGVPCTVVNFTSDTIQCVTGPAPPECSSYPGGRGIVWQVWTTGSTTNWDNLLERPLGYPNSTASNWVVQERMYRDHTYPPIFGERYRINLRYSGYFVPPIDSLYTFSVISDDSSRLYLSPNMSREGMELIAYINGHTTQWDAITTQLSQQIYLKAGQSYYMEALQYQGPGNWNFGVGVKIHNLSWTKDRAVADYEEQILSIQSVIVKETQRINILACPKVQVITLEVDDNETFTYQLSFAGSVTRVLTAADNDSAIATALNSLDTVQSIGRVMVKRNSTAEDYVIELALIFVSTHATIPDIEVVDNDNVSSATAKEYSGPSSTFRVSLDSRVTSDLPVYVPAANVSEALTGLLSTECTTSGAGSVFFKDSYDVSVTRQNYGTLDNYQMPYCGRYSIRNPTVLWRHNQIRDERTSEVTGMLTVTSFGYRFVCFAYYGQIPRSRLRFTLISGSSTPTINIPLDLNGVLNRWNYMCVDAFEAIENDGRYRNPSGIYTMTHIRLNTGSTDFWIDEFSISTREPTIQQGERGVRPGGVAVESLTVESRDLTEPTLICDEENDPLSCDLIVSYYTVEFTVHQCGYMPLMTSPDGTVTISRLLAGSPPVTGTFDLSIEDRTAYNVSVSFNGSEMKTLLERSFPNEGTFDVTRSGTCAGYTWEIKWTQRGGDRPLLSVDEGNVMGHMTEVTVTTTVNGGVWIRPLRGDMLRLPELTPQVQVSVNGIPASCRSKNCSFHFLPDTTPQVTAVSPATGGQDGNPISITGANFGNNIAKVTVSIGNSSCAVMSINDTLITCIPEPSTAGRYKVSVHIDGLGYSVSSEDVMFEYSLSVTSIEPDEGSVSGGNKVTITGTGFPVVSSMRLTPFSRDFYVLFDSYPCLVISSSLTQLTCLPQPHEPDVVNVTVSVRGVEARVPDGYLYDTNLTAIISSINPSMGPAYGGSTVNIYGANFNNETEVSVTIGEADCNVVSVERTRIVCTTGASSPGVFNVLMTSMSFGRAIHSSVLDETDLLSEAAVSLEELMMQNQSAVMQRMDPLPQISFTYKFMVTGIWPCSGSLAGGTMVTIRGAGFGPMVTVAIGAGRMCTVNSVSDEEIRCTTPSTRRHHMIDNNAMDPTRGQYFAWNPQTLVISQGDTVTWQWDGSRLSIPQQFEVHQTSSLTSSNQISGGFSSPSSIMGSFTYTFTQPGTYYYNTFVDDACLSCYMSGTIIVEPLTDIITEVRVYAGTIEAMYQLEWIMDTDVDSEECLSCVNLTNSRVRESSPIFVYSVCDTPMVSWINPRCSTLYSNITIYGSGFGDSQPMVRFGPHSCRVWPPYNDTMITCTLDASSRPSPYVHLPLSLHIPNSGYALLTSNHASHRGVVVRPVITGMSPFGGSVLGGNMLTLEGASFVAAGLRVYLGTEECVIRNVTYDMIECMVPRSVDTQTNSTVELNVTYSGMSEGVKCEIDGGCGYEYTFERTPTIEAVYPMEIGGIEMTLITITGQLLESDSTVMIGHFQCTDVTKTDSENITCLIYPIQAGTYPVTVLVPSYGYAQPEDPEESTIISILRVDSFSPTAGSTRGGTTLTLRGIGFSDTLSNNSVNISGTPCTIRESNYSTIVCITPDLGGEGNNTIDVSVVTATPAPQRMRRNVDTPLIFEYDLDLTPQITAITPVSGQQGDPVTIVGVRLSGSVEVTIGNSVCDVYANNGSQIACLLGANYVGEYPVTVIVEGKGKANGDVTFSYTLRLTSVSPSNNSFAGQNLLTVQGVGFDPVATFITVCGRNCTPSTLQPSLTQISCIVPSFSDVLAANSSLNSQACDVVVTSRSRTETLEEAYTLRRDLTPFVTAINRTRGGTAGGSLIQLQGTGFTNNVNVTIAGVPCAVRMCDESMIVCETGASGRTVRALVMVYVSKKGFAVSDVEFYYVDLWSSRYTWGGLDPPVEGDFVIVPAGQTLVLDVRTPILAILLIQGGELIFDDEQDGVELHSENILIVDGGKLQVGTEDQPYQHKAQIVMYGHRLSTELPLFGAKTLAVRNGTLDLHGKPIVNTWTCLSMTADAGSTVLRVKHDVSDWEVGGTIVIASTSYSRRENEELTIASISADGMTITLTTPLRYKHISMTQTISGKVIETCAEVGYLSRNVVVRGNRLSEWDLSFENCEQDFDPGQFALQTCFNGRFGAEVVGDQFGSQIMLHRGPRDKVIGRIEYIEVTSAGQAFRLGRYPIHFHLNGDVSDSYVRGCGIHHTFNRAVTIHGVDNLLVEKNVAYNILGHAYFLEDGIEEGNIIQYNLGIFVRASSSLLNVDITPATFWVVNPNNTLRHNAAAGGTHFGFWYRLPANPTGPSFTTSVRPLNRPLGQFYNNTAHSFGWYGIWIFPSYHPVRADTCNEVAPAVFENFLAWRNDRGVEFSEVGAVQLKNSVMLDNMLAGVEYTLVTAAWGRNGSFIEDVLIVAHSGLRQEDDAGLRNGVEVCTQAGVKTPHSPYFTVSNVTFVNFNESGCFALQACSHCRDQQGGFESRFEKLVFISSPNRATWKWEHEQVFRGLDDTLTGVAGGALLPMMGALPSPQCSLHDASSSGAVNGAVCDNSVDFARFALANPVPSSLTFRDLVVTSQNGNVTLVYVRKRLRLGAGYMALLPTREVYQLDWSEGERFINISYDALYSSMTASDYLWIRHDFNTHVDVVQINNAVRNASSTVPPGGVSLLGDWYINENETSVTYYVNGTDPTCPNDFRADFSTIQCYYDGCIPPPPPEPPAPRPTGRPNVTQNWSNVSIWPDGQLPSNGSDVYINCSLYVLIDIPLPRLNVLTICGGLEFLETRDHVLEAQRILIDGGQLVAGTQDTPFPRQLTIILNGDLSSDIHRMPNGGPVLGAKALGVFGHLSFHGKERTRMWTHLAQTARAGDNRLVLKEPVDWQPGEEIVIASTYYEARQAEELTVASVSNDGLTVTVDSSLVYEHLGGEHNTDCCTIDISAEVGLLSRNIKILGTHPNTSNDVSDQQSYGCRVLVSNYINSDLGQLTGTAMLSGVEFKGCGQEGFVEPFDPRFSLAFLNIGSVQNDTSFVRNCSFHKGYNTGIGVFGVRNMSITNNVVHHTVGPSFHITGSNHRLIENLAVVALFPGTYRGRNEVSNTEWTANFELIDATDYLLIGNSAAGGAKAGYHTNGENCIPEDFTPTWRDNIAHSTLHGIHVAYRDGHTRGQLVGCSAFHKFTIYSCYHYGLFAYSRAGINITNSLFVNNYAATFVAVIGPAALSHQVGNKTVHMQDTRIISSISPGGVDGVNCTEYSHRPTIAFHSQSRSGLQSPGGGHVGIILTSFTSGPGHFPLFPWSSVSSYPAISGLTRLTNVSFCNFGTRCSRREVALMTHPRSEDCQHPVWLEGVTYLYGTNSSKFYNHNPILGSINPSDCVDMDCDGLKKILIRDMDGSFTGNNQPGLYSMVSRSEYEWDGDRRRGLGDFRIPFAMLSTPSGNRIDPDVLYPNKGIYRGSNGACQWNPDWNSYHCHDVDHMMLVIESLDADTEVRRLSPIGVGANGYIDLINGPQDHGWCGGYTCQERISTFYAIVSTGLVYTIGLTSTNPQRTNFILLDATEQQSLLIGLIYNNPQRLDIYVGTEYIIPTNGYLQDGNLRYRRGDDFVPSLTDPHGTNYYNRTEKKLYILIRGGAPVRVETTQVIQLGINLPPITIDEFFEVDLINNLARLLGILPNRIRIVNVISEGGTRKRQVSGGTRVEVEIGDAPSNETTPTTVTPGGNETTDPYNNMTTTMMTGGDETFQELLNITTRVSEVIQTGELSQGIGYMVLNAEVTEPQPVVTDPTGGQRATNGTGGPQPGDSDAANLTTYSERQRLEEEQEMNMTQEIILSIPSNLGVLSLPVESFEGLPIRTPIHVAMYDTAGMVVSTLGIGRPWELTTSIASRPTEVFLNNDTVSMGNGTAMFSNLVISHPGSYRLRFNVTYPPGANFSLVTTNLITVRVRNLRLFIDAQPPMTSNTTFPFPSNVTVHVLDSSIEGRVITAELGWRGRVWYMRATFVSVATGQVLTGTEVSVRIVGGVAHFPLLHVRMAGSYRIRFSVYTEPGSTSDELPAHVDSNVIEVQQFQITRFTVVFNNSYDEIVRGFEDSFIARFTERLQMEYPGIKIYNVTVQEGSIMVSFFATSESVETLRNFVQNLPNSQFLQEFSFRGVPLSLSSVQQDPDYPLTEETDDKYRLIIIICSAVGGAILLVLCLIILVICCYCCCCKKRDKLSKQSFEENVYDDRKSSTIYSNTPIFDDSEEYPTFHLTSVEDGQSLDRTPSVKRKRSHQQMELKDIESKSYKSKEEEAFRSEKSKGASMDELLADKSGQAANENVYTYF